MPEQREGEPLHLFQAPRAEILPLLLPHMLSRPQVDVKQFWGLIYTIVHCIVLLLV